MISVIIPTYNEQERITNTLHQVIEQNLDCEIIVVDGGSTDSTINIVNGFSEVRVFVSDKGRAKQMNYGAQFAKGAYLVFLHADTLLPQNGLQEIEGILSEKSISGGSFFIKFDKKSVLLNLYSLFSRINHPLFTYGDQAIFIKKDIFRAIGGYKNIPIMEDVDIIQRLRKRGRFIKLNKAVITSSRRFEKNGTLWQQLKNMLLVFLFMMGISPTWLQKFY